MGMIYELYGIVGKPSEDNSISICEPIFRKTFRKKLKSFTKYYRRINGRFIEIDIRKYGEPIYFLPPSKKVMNERRDRLYIFKQSFNATKKEFRNYGRIPQIRDKSDDDMFFIPGEITVGIRFPNYFVCVMKDNLDEKELESCCNFK